MAELKADFRVFQERIAQNSGSHGGAIGCGFGELGGLLEVFAQKCLESGHAGLSSNEDNAADFLFVGMRLFEQAFNQLNGAFDQRSPKLFQHFLAEAEVEVHGEGVVVNGDEGDVEVDFLLGV